MSTQIALKEHSDDLVIRDLENTQKICQTLMKTPHYAKMGEIGIYAIIQKAKSIGMNPLEALNGGMYFVQGKVEMQGQSMLAMIRQHGHSVSLDPKSTNSHVIMHGKRSDNGDSWTVEFTIDDAKRAGIHRGQWEKYPKVMLMWRCVSMLSRFLFSDILKGCYVQGEISEAVTADQMITSECSVQEEKMEIITSDQGDELLDIMMECSEEDKLSLTNFLKRNKLETVYQLPFKTYEKLRSAALLKREEYLKSIKEEAKQDAEVVNE